MDLEGRRESENVEDRRGMSGGAMAGMGIGGIILIGLITLLMGGNPLDVIQQTGGLGGMSGGEEEVAEGQTFSPEEEAQVKFCKQILASTEDIWSAVFRQKFNAEYTPPTLVFFKNSVQTNCGGATSAVGPFYCSADQKLYIDLSFFKQMETQLKSGGDFARAYVIAHEVGHHVENLLGILGKAHAQMQRLDQTRSKAFGSLDDSDLKEAINCAQHIGDNYLQEQSQGYSQPESFTHGTSDQRMRWLKRGFDTGDMSTTTFTGNYSDL